MENLNVLNLNDRPESSWRPAAIPKKDGSSRYLLIPNDALKKAQFNILQELYKHKELKPLPCVVGFCPRRNTMTGALQHSLEAAVVIGMDCHNFFPSFPVEKVKEQLLLYSSFNRAEIDYIMDICVFHGKKREQLPMGAPTSPMLTNIGMKPVDMMLEKVAANCGYTYTRYADDICFASKEGVSEEDALKARVKLIQTTAKIINDNLGISMSWKKLRTVRKVSPKTPMHITGICVRQDNKGYHATKSVRKKARAICHGLYKKLKAGIPADDLQSMWRKLKGLVAYCDYIKSHSEPGYNGADKAIPGKEFNYIERCFR